MRLGQASAFKRATISAAPERGGSITSRSALASGASAIQVTSGIYVDLLTSEDVCDRRSTAELEGAYDLSGWNPVMDTSLRLSYFADGRQHR